MYAIIGNSGEVKSTMLSILAGLDVPDRGFIKFRGNDIKDKGVLLSQKKEHLTGFSEL